MPTADGRAARERKQKIFVAVGGLVLLALVALQLPRLLGGGSSAAPATTEATVAGQPATIEPEPASPRPVVLVNTDRPVAPAPGQLSSFSEFSGKDPFVQQVTFAAAAAAAVAASGAKEGQEGETNTSSKGFTVAGTPAASVTVISVNGARQALVPGAAFPASDPVFVLVSEQPKAKTVTIGVAGGAYASGAKSTKLVVGKPLVLVNTTTGARYKLVLVAVGNGEASTATEDGASSDNSKQPPASTP